MVFLPQYALAVVEDLQLASVGVVDDVELEPVAVDVGDELSVAVVGQVAVVHLQHQGSC